MRVRWIGLTLALVALGVAAGYGLGMLRQEDPTTFAAEPVPASAPSYPVIPVVVLPDPDFPALQPGLPLHQATVGSAPFDFTLPIPRGWRRSDPTSGEWHWYPPPTFVKNTYFVRVKLLGNLFQPVGKSLDQRISALENAEDVADLEIESRDADSLVASYVSGRYRRVTFEKFVPDSSGTTYASIGVIGREEDRDGLQDLFDRITADAVTP
jgi:hypothetical protein